MINDSQGGTTNCLIALHCLHSPSSSPLLLDQWSQPLCEWLITAKEPLKGCGCHMLQSNFGNHMRRGIVQGCRLIAPHFWCQTFILEGSGHGCRRGLLYSAGQEEVNLSLVFQFCKFHFEISDCNCFCFLDPCRSTQVRFAWQLLEFCNIFPQLQWLKSWGTQQSYLATQRLM